MAPGALPAAKEPMGNKRPPGLTEATPLAPILRAPSPELRRGDLKEQTPRTARAVLTRPFDVEPYQMHPAYMTDISPSQSRWTSPEPPASPRDVSGTTDATGPGECASHNSPVHEAAVRQETGWNQPQGMREAPNRFSGEVSDTCLLYTSPSPRDKRQSRMPSSA